MKEELIKDFPQDVADKKTILGAIQELVDSRLRIDAEKLLQKETYAMVEELQVDKGFVKKQADLLYDKLYNESKLLNAMYEQQEMLETFESEFK